MPSEVVPAVEKKTKVAKVEAEIKSDPDLSAAIIKSLTKEGDIVRCKRVHGHYYRVNWLKTDTSGKDVIIQSFRTVQSKFMRASIGEDKQLTVEDKTVTK